MAELAAVSDSAARAREFVLDAHRETVETVLRCADAVAAEWDEPAAAEGEATAEGGATADADRLVTTDRGAVADPLRAELEARGIWGRLPDVLAGAVRAAGYSLSASPVADPPYVAATSRGPMLRATVPDGRLVVLLCVFEVERDGEDGSSVRYARGPTTPEDAVRVTFE